MEKIMFRLVATLVFLTGISAADTLFEDDFEDGNADGWVEFSSVPDSAVYYVDQGWYHFLNYPADASTCALCGDVPDPDTPHMSIADYSFYCRAMSYTGTTHLGFAVRMQAPFLNQQAYVLWLRYSENDFVIWRQDGSVSTSLGQVGFPLAYGETYWIRFEAVSDYFRAKVWQGDLADEPAEWQLSVSDATYSEPGSIGMVCHSYESTEKHAAFDHVLVTGVPYSFNPCTWAGIKNSF